MTSKRVLSVGQCGYDHSRIRQFLKESVHAEVEGAESTQEALELLKGSAFSLVLVNRVLDRNGRPGMELIEAMKADPTLAPVPVMLVSNYPDAQDAAEAAGALRGFGKAEVGTAEVTERIRTVLASD